MMNSYIYGASLFPSATCLCRGSSETPEHLCVLASSPVREQCAIDQYWRQYRSHSSPPSPTAIAAHQYKLEARFVEPTHFHVLYTVEPIIRNVHKQAFNRAATHIFIVYTQTYSLCTVQPSELNNGSPYSYRLTALSKSSSSAGV